MWLLAPFSFQLFGMDFVWLATKVLLNQWYTAQYLRKKVEVAQLCLTLCDLRDYTVHGILQARILEWAAFPFSRGSSGPRNRTRVFCTAGGFFTKTGKEKDYEDKRKGEVNPCNSDWTQTQSKPMVLLTKITHLFSGLNETQVLDVPLQKEFSEKQSDK